MGHPAYRYGIGLLVGEITVKSFLESLIDSALYQELVDAGRGLDIVNGEHLRPRLLIMLDNESSDFYLISHVIDVPGEFVWALSVVKRKRPHIAAFDTGLFSTWAENAGIPPWDNAYRFCLYKGERTLGQILAQVVAIMREPSPGSTTVLDGYELEVYYPDEDC
mgnify:CR=1 FL=1